MRKKLVVLMMAGALSVTAIIGGSFAWFTSSDKVDNEFELANVGAKITEVFEPKTVVPGLEIKKNVAISNDKSNVEILVRVKMSEVLKTLVEGTDGAPKITWNPAIGASDPNQVLKASDAFITTVSTAGSGWETITLAGNSNLTIYRKAAVANASTNHYTYFAYDTATKQLAQIESPVLNANGTALTSATVTYAVNTWDTAKSADVTIANGGAITAAGDIHNYINFVYGSGVVADPAGAVNAATNWFYFDGYFYYNKVLAPGAETTSLITGVNFSGSLPNSFQGARFTLTPNLEAIQATKAAISSTASGWGITDPTVLARLQALCAN